VRNSGGTLREQAILLAAALAIAPLGANAADVVVWCEKGFYPEENEAIAKNITAFERKSASQGEFDQPSKSAIIARRRPRSWLRSRPTSCSDSEPPPANMANGSTRTDPKSCRSQSVRAGCARLPHPVRCDDGPARPFRAALRREVEMLESVPLMLRYESVMSRPEHRAAGRLTMAELGAALDTIPAIVMPVTISYLRRPMLRDPDDELVLETAVNRRADLVLTFSERDFAGAERVMPSISRPGPALQKWLEELT
jgi:predicted nucleic acid-binding protein